MRIPAPILPAKPDPNGIITSNRWAVINDRGEVVGLAESRDQGRSWPIDGKKRVAKALVIVCVKRGKR